MLTATGELPRRPTRVLVAGTSGSGKTTVASAVAEQRPGLPIVRPCSRRAAWAWLAGPLHRAAVPLDR